MADLPPPPPPPGAPPPPAMRACPKCQGVIPLSARRCQHCSAKVPVMVEGLQKPKTVPAWVVIGVIVLGLVMLALWAAS